MIDAIIEMVPLTYPYCFKHVNRVEYTQASCKESLGISAMINLDYYHNVSPNPLGKHPINILTEEIYND